MTSTERTPGELPIRCPEHCGCAHFEDKMNTRMFECGVFIPHALDAPYYGGRSDAKSYHETMRREAAALVDQARIDAETRYADGYRTTEQATDDIHNAVGRENAVTFSFGPGQPLKRTNK